MRASSNWGFGGRAAWPGLVLAASLLVAGCPPAGEPTYLTDDAGGALILHGVNSNNGAKYDPARVGWTTQADIERLATWGFNVVRLLVLWDGLEPAPGVYDPATRIFELIFDERLDVSGPTRIVLPAARLYPEGWDVAVSDPAGTWSGSFDATAQRLTLVTSPGQARHTIRITPSISRNG